MLNGEDTLTAVPNTVDGRKRFCLIACRVLWRELNYYAAQSPHDIEFIYLEQGLHNTPDKLRSTVQQQIDAVDAGRFDSVLIGYGLCSNGIVGLRARSAQLVVPRAHDCITFLLGSKERYQEYFDTHPGTYWYSPGWIDCSNMPGPERFEIVFREYCEKYGEDNARYLMKRTEDWVQNYSNLTYVDLGFGDTSAFKQYARRCAEWLGWKYEELRGDPKLVRRFVSGDWPESEFLIVPPGRTVAADYTQPTVIRAE